MEEIKFRAWNHAKEDWEEDSFDCDLDEEQKGTSYNLYVVNTMWQGGNNGSLYTFELSTLLTDKNGVEIYDGDIVKFHDHPTGVEDGIGKVYYKDGKWLVTWSMIPLGDFGSVWTEVIGNVHEHPELLEGRHEA